MNITMARVIAVVFAAHVILISVGVGPHFSREAHTDIRPDKAPEVDGEDTGDFGGNAGSRIHQWISKLVGFFSPQAESYVVLRDNVAVYKSSKAHQVDRRLNKGDVVKAAGAIVNDYGIEMLPIHPTGAVDVKSLQKKAELNVDVKSPQKKAELNEPDDGIKAAENTEALVQEFAHSTQASKKSQAEIEVTDGSFQASKKTEVALKETDGSMNAIKTTEAEIEDTDGSMTAAEQTEADIKTTKKTKTEPLMQELDDSSPVSKKTQVDADEDAANDAGDGFDEEGERGGLHDFFDEEGESFLEAETIDDLEKANLTMNQETTEGSEAPWSCEDYCVMCKDGSTVFFGRKSEKMETNQKKKLAAVTATATILSAALIGSGFGMVILGTGATLVSTLLLAGALTSAGGGLAMANEALEGRLAKWLGKLPSFLCGHVEVVKFDVKFTGGPGQYKMSIDPQAAAAESYVVLEDNLAVYKSSKAHQVDRRLKKGDVVKAAGVIVNDYRYGIEMLPIHPTGAVDVKSLQKKAGGGRLGVDILKPDGIESYKQIVEQMKKSAEQDDKYNKVSEFIEDALLKIQESKERLDNRAEPIKNQDKKVYEEGCEIVNQAGKNHAKRLFKDGLKFWKRGKSICKTHIGNGVCTCSIHSELCGGPVENIRKGVSVKQCKSWKFKR